MSSMCFGQREVLGLKVGTSEAEPIWADFLRSLNRSGPRGVKLVISDNHEGIKAAISKVQKAIFPNDASFTRLARVTMMEQNDEWSLNQRYMWLEGLQTLSAPTRLSAVAR